VVQVVQQLAEEQHALKSMIATGTVSIAAGDAAAAATTTLRQPPQAHQLADGKA
jgi:hypothetical protein